MPEVIPASGGLRHAAAALALATIATYPCHPSAQTTPSLPPPAPIGFTPASGYRLVKNWDFATLIRDGAALRKEFYTRYVYSNGTLDHLNDEWSRYADSNNHPFTPHGLSLVARLIGALAPGGIQSGMLRSRWTGQYGVFEIRMKVPPGRGMWPAFWLNPQDQRWPPEIDVVEIVNNGKDTTRNSFHFLHPEAAGPVDAGTSKLDGNHALTPGFDYANNAHVFAVEWTKERVRHYLDGTLIADRPYRWSHGDGSDGGPAHVLVNLAVGGKWPGPPTDAKSFPATLDVDYIRVWQR